MLGAEVEAASSPSRLSHSLLSPPPIVGSPVVFVTGPPPLSRRWSPLEAYRSPCRSLLAELGLID